MGILDHVGVSVRDYARSKVFYEKALAPLGIGVIMEFESFCGLGRDGKPELWLGAQRMSFQTEEQARVITPIHIAISARSREEVDAFYEAAIAAGGKDYGAPGLRPQYHPAYYGAFVLDPDGHDLEAVFHGG